MAETLRSTVGLAALVPKKVTDNMRDNIDGETASKTHSRQGA